jgi:CheY-like chemotaxis protein
MLAELGLQDVATAQNGQAALGHLERRPYEVLLSELRLEPESGFELFEAARSRAPRISGLLMSASATARDVETSRDLGIVEVVSRPFTTERLATALARAVAAARGLWGEVQQLTLLDMLQMYHYGRRSMVVHLTGEAVGRIFVRGGEIVHATADELRGLTALCRLLQASSGVLRIEALPSPTERTIRRPFAAVLLEALHRLDEEAIRRPSEGPRLPEELGNGFETVFGELLEGDRDLAPERL